MVEPEAPRVLSLLPQVPLHTPCKAGRSDTRTPSADHAQVLQAKSCHHDCVDKQCKQMSQGIIASKAHVLTESMSNWSVRPSVNRSLQTNSSSDRQQDRQQQP